MTQQFLCHKSCRLLTKCMNSLSRKSKNTFRWIPSDQHVLRQQVACMSFFEPDRKGGYKKPHNMKKTQMIKDGVKMLRPEFNMWCDEVKEKFTCDRNYFDVRHEDYEYVWKFHDRNSVEEWMVTTDQDNSEGYSQAHFIFSKNNTGLFHGQLSQKVPKDGIIHRTGYANIRSPTKFASFKRQDVHDWSPFTHLLLKVRGDGRPYMLTIGLNRFFDINWNDQFHYTLFTRGGPYWQIAKIPFSKFYVTSKGRIQDKQERIELDKVTHLGFTLGDGNEGPFYLEIDSVAVMFDENHGEEFAYELYQADPTHVNT